MPPEDDRSLLLPPSSATRVTTRRRDQSKRNIASRVSVALAVLMVVSALQRHLWGHFGLLYEVFPWLGETTARFSFAVAAILLLGASRGLRNGHRVALWGAVGALLFSVVLHISPGYSTLWGLLPLAGAIWLIWARKAFTVHVPAATMRRLVGYTAIALAVLIAMAVVIYVLTDDVADTIVDERALRVVRALEVVAFIAFLITLVWVLLAPRRPVRLSPADHLRDRERARGIVERHGGGTLDYFALRDDKDYFFAGDSVVAYSTRSGVCLVSPDPIGPATEREEVWEAFVEYAEAFGWSLCVVAGTDAWRPIYEASGLRSIYLGDEATVDCSQFTLSGKSKKSLRHAVSRVERAGYTTTFHDPAHLEPELAEQLRAMAEESRRGESERGFSMTLSRLLDPSDEGLWLSVTRNAEGRVDAFIQWVPARDIDGWSLDVMRRRLDVADLPNGLIDFTIAQTIAQLGDEGGPHGIGTGDGARGLGLNFAVMRGVLKGESSSRLDGLVKPLLQRFSKGTQMETLATFNEKYDPTWTARWLMVDAPEFVTAQLLVMADAEGVTEVPVIGRFFDHAAEYTYPRA